MRSLPHCDPTIEARYLASIFAKPTALEECPVRTEELASPQHQAILGAMLALRAKGAEVTPLAVMHGLEGRAAAQQRSIEVSSILELDPVECARRIRELAERRRLHAAAQQALLSLHDGDAASARAAMADAALSEDDSDDPVLSFRQMLATAVQSLADSKRSQRYMTLGTPSLDEIFRAGPGDLIVIGAATGTGKSTLVNTWGMSLARRTIPAGIISVEDGPEDYGSKGLHAISGVPANALWSGAVNAEQQDAMLRAIDEEGNLPLSFAKVRSRSVEGVISRMSHMARVRGAKVIMVDYLQAIRHREIGRDTREKVNDTLGMLMAAAAQLEVALVLCSQLRRKESGASQFSEPHIGDLKESGDIENSAQAIVLLWRETDQRTDPRFGAVFANVAKVKRAEAGARFWMRRNRHGLLEEQGAPPPQKHEGNANPYVRRQR